MADIRLEVVGGAEHAVDDFIKETNREGCFWFKGEGTIPFSSLLDDMVNVEHIEQLERTARMLDVKIRRKPD